VEENKKQIFISVISYKDKELNSDFDQMTNEEYIEKMVQITSGFSKEGYQVILASFCREEGDLDAAQEIKNQCGYIVEQKGGDGAVRAFIEIILKARGQWEQSIQRVFSES